MRYEERQWVPIWGALVVVLFWGGFVFGIPLFLVYRDGGSVDTFGRVFLAVMFPLTIGYPIWTNARRRIRIDDEFLRVGRREPIPLEAVEGFGILTGRPLRRVRSQLFWPTPSGKLSAAIAGLAILGAWGSAGGLATLSGHWSRYGVVCPFWTRYGLLVHAPFEPEERTTWTPKHLPDVWLIATRRPEEIRDALLRACEERRAALRGHEQVHEQLA